MSSRWKKVWADFWGNKSRTVLTILTIGVGVFAVGLTGNMGAYMIESMDTDYLSARPSEAEVYAGPLDDKMVKIAREVPGVDAVEGRSSTYADVVQPGAARQISIRFTSLDDSKPNTVNQLKPALGETSLPPLGEKEILVDASAKTLGYEPGDVITVELSDGKRRELVLAGYMHDVTGFPFSFTYTMNAYVTPKTLKWLGGYDGYDSLMISVAENQTDQDHVTAVAQAVADRVERAGATVYYVHVYQPGHHFAYSITQGIISVLTILGYMTVLLSGFLIVNTVTALMTQQTRHIGIMKAVGGANSQILAMYMVLILGFGLAALLIGFPLANTASEWLGGGMAEYLNFYTLPYRAYPSAVIQQVFVALIVPVLAALLPIYNSVRVSVREAISDYGIGGNAKPKQKSVNKGVVLIPRPIRLSLRNAFRKRTRLALTLFTLVLGGAIFIGIYNLWASFDKTMEDIQGYFMADINISFGRYYRFDEVAPIAQSVPGVSSVEGWTEYAGTLIMDEDKPGTQIAFIAPPSTSTLIQPIITAGRWLETGDENAVVIGNHLLNVFPDLKVGDWLTVEIDGKETKWHIIGVYNLTGNVSPPLLYTNYEYLSRIIGEPGQVYSLRVLTDQHDAISQKRLSQQIEALYKKNGIQFSSTQLGAEWIQDQKSTTDILVRFLLVMAIMIAIVGGLGLMGTMSINVLERTREIGVMRAVGASNADIQGIVIVEGMVIGLISWAISILFSIPITGALCYVVGVAIMTSPLPVVYGTTGIIAWLIFTLVLATIASALPARRASSLTVRDTLAYE
ncbi:MAG: ABC transporter permease [Anaerolineales bacterium]|nr:ABC transporter permease [Anaerolineales bacterium]